MHVPVTEEQMFAKIGRLTMTVDGLVAHATALEAELMQQQQPPPEPDSDAPDAGR